MYCSKVICCLIINAKCRRHVFLLLSLTCYYTFSVNSAKGLSKWIESDINAMWLEHTPCHMAASHHTRSYQHSIIINRRGGILHIHTLPSRQAIAPEGSVRSNLQRKHSRTHTHTQSLRSNWLMPHSAHRPAAPWVVPGAQRPSAS